MNRSETIKFISGTDIPNITKGLIKYRNALLEGDYSTALLQKETIGKIVREK